MSAPSQPRTLTARARTLRRQQTHCESLLWSRLRNRRLGGLKFHRQFAIGPYVVDFVCWERRLIIEVDGGQHDAAASLDQRRTAWLAQRGFRVLRFWNIDVTENLPGVLETVLSTLEAQPASGLSPHPSPRGEVARGPRTDEGIGDNSPLGSFG